VEEEIKPSTTQFKMFSQTKTENKPENDVKIKKYFAFRQTKIMFYSIQG
jgi:hypothetical protein